MKEKNTIIFILLAVFIFTARSYSITNGENAVDCLGQSDPALPAQAVFNKDSANNGPNNLGFACPLGVDIDRLQHRLFVADSANNRVLVYNLSTNNTLTDKVADYVLGQTDFISNSGGTTQSKFFNPRTPAYDETNNRLFVTDYGNNRVLVFDVTAITDGENAVYVLGQTDFITKTSTITQAGMSAPDGTAIDAGHNRLFVADSCNNRVLVFNIGTLINGQLAANVLGQSNFGVNSATTTQYGMNNPAGIEYDSANNRLFVSDSLNSRVLVFDVTAVSNGENAAYVLGQSGFTAKISTNSQAGMSSPQGLAYNSNSRLLYVSDGYYNRILAFDVTGITNGENAVNVLGQADFISGDSTVTQSGMNYPGGLAFDNTNRCLYVCDGNNNRVLAFDATSLADGENAVDCLGQFVPPAASQVAYTRNSPNNGPNSSGFYIPHGIALDIVNHHLFISDSLNNRVLVFNLDINNALIDKTADSVLGQPDFTSYQPSIGRNGLNNPAGLAYDSTNKRLFVADRGNNRIMVFDVNVVINNEDAVYVLGQINFTSNPGATTQSGLNSPEELVYDDAGKRLFVADSLNNRIMVFDVTAITNGENAVNVLGQASFTSKIASKSRNTFNYAGGITYDDVNRRLFVSDSCNNRVLAFDVTAITDGEDAVNVLGQADFTSNAAAASQSGMKYPHGCDYDKNRSRLFVLDSGNYRTLIFDAASIIDGENAVNVIGQADFAAGASSFTAVTQNNLQFPLGILFHNNELLVADSINNRIMIFRENTVSIGGIIKDNLDNNMTGVTVLLNGSESKTAVSAADGTYLFPSLASGGNYTVAPVKSFYLFNPPSVSTGQVYSNIQNWNFIGAVSMSSYSIEGFVVDSASGGIAGITITLTGNINASTMTSADGHYRFDNLPVGGYYAVMPSLLNHSFTPVARSTAPLNGSINNWNFVTTISLPVLYLSASSLEFGGVYPGFKSKLPLGIYNTGTGTLSGTISKNRDWISLNTTSFSGNTTVYVTIDNGLLNQSSGNYEGTLSINSNGGNLDVPVRFTATCVLVRPNPFRLSSPLAGEGRGEGVITFFGDGIVPGQTTIKIYTLSGELIDVISQQTTVNSQQQAQKNYGLWTVDSGHPSITWNPSNLVPGIYLYTFESPRERGINKFTVIK